MREELDGKPQMMMGRSPSMRLSLQLMDGLLHPTTHTWVAGTNGQTCDTVCIARGETCDNAHSEVSALTTYDLVAAAWAQAGYTCNGAHDNRDYAGTPFSTSRSDDCAPLIAGATSVCNSNAAGHHKPLCYCKGSAAT